MNFCKQTLVVCCALGALMLASALSVFGAVCTVTNTSDSGAGSLRACIANAGSGDTINFSLTYPATITLTSGVLAISNRVGSNLSISGPGPRT